MCVVAAAVTGGACCLQADDSRRPIQSNLGRQQHVVNADLPHGGLQKRSDVIEGSETGQTSVKLPQVAAAEQWMRTSDGISGSEEDESYSPCGETRPLKNTV